MADAELIVELQCTEGQLEKSAVKTPSHLSSTTIEDITESYVEIEHLKRDEKDYCTDDNLVRDGMHSKDQGEHQQISSNESTPSHIDIEFDKDTYIESPVLIDKALNDENIQVFSNESWWKLDMSSEPNSADQTAFHKGSKPPNDGRSWKLCSSDEELKRLDLAKSNAVTNSFKTKLKEDVLVSGTDLEAKQDNESVEEILRISCPKRPSIDAESVPPPLDPTNRKWIRYSRDQLLMLMCAPASKVWPDYFDIAFKKSEGKIDLEKWMRAKQESKLANGISAVRPTTVTNGTINSNGPSERAPEPEVKRSKDPRERIKQEEQVRVVLSPQRKSFSTGCHVSQQGPSLNLGGPDGNIDRSRELPVNRRIGSGRIPRREDHEQMNPVDNRRDRENDKDLDQRRDHKGWRSKNDGGGRFDRDDRHLDKRRRFFDDEDKRNDRRDTYRDSRDRRFDHRRSGHKDYEEETPEWFTGGPSSQNEFIELVGFDEPEREDTLGIGRPKRERRRSRKEKEGGSGKSSRCTTPVIIEQEEPSEFPVDEKVAESQLAKPENPIVVEPPDDQDQDAIQFNVEDYLGSILNIGSEEIFQGGNAGASRLKQFFNSRESPPVIEQNRDLESRRSSPGKENFSHLGNLLGFAEPLNRNSSPPGSKYDSTPGSKYDSTPPGSKYDSTPPGSKYDSTPPGSKYDSTPPGSKYDSTRFFTPISPADKTNGESLVDMLQKANTKKIHQPPVAAGSGRLPPPSIKDLIMGGKGQSLEEIEANLRKGGQSMCGMSSRMNHQHLHGFNVGKQQAVQQAHMRQNHINQQNPFNDFLLKDGGNSSSGSIGNKTVMSIVATENELLARLMKEGNANINPGNLNPTMSSMNIQTSRPPPSLSNLNLAPHNLNPNHVPSSLPQHSPSRAHMMPQTPQQLSSTNNSEIFMKLMQNQQQQMQQKQQQQQQHQHHHQQQQQQKQHMLHPGYQTHPQHNDPIKQLLGGMNNMGLHSQQNKESSRDVHTLLQRVANGQLTDTQLIAQLSSGNLTQSQRETVGTVLKLMTCHSNSTANLLPPRANLTPSPTPQTIIGGGLSLGNATASLSPRVASPNPDAAGMLAPHMMQQTRVSPLMFGGNAAPRRTPSHQELVVHAQSILQKALLKNELERAKEKHRKREAERTRSPNPAAVSIQNGPQPIQNPLNRANQMQDGSPTKGPKCQSPLAFTPIAVLRKMTADKDRMDKDKQECYNISEAEKSHNRMANHHQNSMHHGMNMKDKKIPKVPSPLPSCNSMLGPRAQMVMSGAPSAAMMNLGNHPGLVPHQRHMSMQPSMQPSMQMGRTNLHHNANNIRVMQHAQQQQQQQQQQHQQQQAQQMMRNLAPPHMNNLSHHSMHTRMPNTHNPMQHMMAGNNNYKSGDTSLDVPQRPIGSQSSSPINNFMNFFGRDMIAKVQAGTMPELPGGKVLSLEEVERQHTQAVPN